MGAETIIRPATAGDRNAWGRLWRDYLAFYETTLPEAQYDLTWERIIAGEAIFALIAEADGAPVGLAHYMYHSSTWTDGPYCYLQDLYVDPTVRGGGVGRKLIERLYEIADDAGAAQVYWLTQDFNETARILYDRVGQLTPFIKYKNR